MIKWTKQKSSIRDPFGSGIILYSALGDDQDDQEHEIWQLASKVPEALHNRSVPFVSITYTNTLTLTNTNTNTNTLTRSRKRGKQGSRRSPSIPDPSHSSQPCASDPILLSYLFPPSYLVMKRRRIKLQAQYSKTKKLVRYTKNLTTCNEMYQNCVGPSLTGPETHTKGNGPVTNTFCINTTLMCMAPAIQQSECCIIVYCVHSRSRGLRIFSK